jgi:hypothetical protein
VAELAERRAADMQGYLLLTGMVRAFDEVPLLAIQRQLGHTNLGITSIYVQGMDSGEIIDTVHARRAPMISARPVASTLILQVLIQRESSGQHRPRPPLPCPELAVLIRPGRPRASRRPSVARVSRDTADTIASRCTKLSLVDSC